tara:strand:- start:593 stop:1204 length:612 start_codon:yes stop_codon:yes gene_type:complete
MGQSISKRDTCLLMNLITNRITQGNIIKNTKQIITCSKREPQNIGLNFFFDILSDDIREYIYIMRIDDILNGKKKFLMDMVDELPGYYMPDDGTPYTTPGQLYYQPHNVEVRAVLYYAARILTFYDANIDECFCERLIVLLLLPVERGLLLYHELALRMNDQDGYFCIYYNIVDRLLNNLTSKLYSLRNKRIYMLENGRSKKN